MIAVKINQFTPTCYTYPQKEKNVKNKNSGEDIFDRQHVLIALYTFS